MNKRMSGTLSAVLMASVVLGGIGVSPLSADAKTTKVKPVVVSSKDKKAITDYVKKTKADLGKTRDTLSELDDDTLKRYDDKDDYFGVGKFKVMESSSYKAGSVYIQNSDKENVAELKKLTDSNKKLVTELSKVKTVADVTKHRKNVSLFKKRLANLEDDVLDNAENAEDLSNVFDSYMEKQVALSEIIYGDELERVYAVETSYLLTYEEKIDYEIAMGKRVDISWDKRYRLNDSLFVRSYKDVENEYFKFAKGYVYKIAKGDLVGAHTDYMTYKNGVYKNATEKWNALVKKEYDRAFKLK